MLHPDSVPVSMRPLASAILILWLSSAASVPAFAQHLKSACELLTRTDVESATNLPLDRQKALSFSPSQMVGMSAASQCNYYDSRTGQPPDWAEIRVKFVGAMLFVAEYIKPNPNAFLNTAKLAQVAGPDGTINPGDIEADLGDAALWEPNGSCQLDVFIGGTTELALRVNGMRDQSACRMAARNLVLKALGRSGRTGYRYNRPTPQIVATNNPASRVGPVSAAQRKTACELIAKTDVESIMGFRVLGPRPGPAKPIASNSHVAFPSELASSGCFFEPALAETKRFNAGVEIGIRYLPPTDALLLQQRLLKEIQGASDTQADRGGRDFPYPALWANVGSTFAVFKEDATGTTILQVSSYGPSRQLPNIEIYTDQLAHDIRLATKILGPRALPGTLYSQIVRAVDTLRGHTEMAVQVWVNNKVQEPDDRARVAMESALRQAGIKLLRLNPNTVVPTLELHVSEASVTCYGGAVGGGYLDLVSLDFVQTVPFSGTGPNQRFIIVPTWSIDRRTTGQAYWEVVPGMVREFVQDYLKANPPGARR